MNSKAISRAGWLLVTGIAIMIFSRFTFHPTCSCTNCQLSRAVVGFPGFLMAVSGIRSLYKLRQSEEQADGEPDQVSVLITCPHCGAKTLRSNPTCLSCGRKIE